MKKITGFSLIELMVTVAIVAILAAVAYPSYRKQIMRSNRAEARAALLQVQVAQEKFFLQNNRYAGSTELSPSPTASTPGLGVNATTPAGNYKITLTSPSSTTYTATATPNGGQADDTSCSTFTIDQTGTRTPLPATGCWK